MNNLESENVIVAIGVLSILADEAYRRRCRAVRGVARTVRRNLPPDAAHRKNRQGRGAEMNSIEYGRLQRLRCCKTNLHISKTMNVERSKIVHRSKNPDDWESDYSEEVLIDGTVEYNCELTGIRLSDCTRQALTATRST